jgi:hypothetical protein
MCKVDYGMSCPDLARFYERKHPGVDHRPKRLRELWGKLCRGELGKGIKGTGYIAEVCLPYGRMLRDGLGGAAEPEVALEAFAKACRDWPQSCADAAALGDAQSRIWAERGCEGGDQKACDLLEKRSPDKAKGIYQKLCGTKRFPFACDRLKAR